MPIAKDTGGSLDPMSTPQKLVVDEDNLRESLADLSRLTMGDGQEGLEGLLKHVAEYAVRAIPGADGAGLTLLEADRVNTMVASTDFVSEVDAVQYGIGEGPCITAAATGQTVMSGSLSSEERWPQFGPEVERLGVHSALSLPLKTANGVVGAMNVYAHAHDAFDERAVELGELFAVPAAISAHNARVLAETRRLTVEVHRAVKDKAAIDRATGVFMSRTGASASEARAQLESIQLHDAERLADVAQRVLDDSTGHPESRTSPSDE